jgi:hypothetical protein
LGLRDRRRGRFAARTADCDLNAFAQLELARGDHRVARREPFDHLDRSGAPHAGPDLHPLRLAVDHAVHELIRADRHERFLRHRQRVLTLRHD